METWQKNLVEVVRGSIYSARRAAEAAHAEKMKARCQPSLALCALSLPSWICTQGEGGLV